MEISGQNTFNPLRFDPNDPGLKQALEDERVGALIAERAARKTALEAFEQEQETDVARIRSEQIVQGANGGQALETTIRTQVEQGRRLVREDITVLVEQIRSQSQQAAQAQANLTPERVAARLFGG